MKLLAQILIAASLVLGVLSASSAYLAPVSQGARLAGLTLAAPAGGKPGASAVVADGTTLTPEIVEQLRLAGVKYIKLKESPFVSLNPGGASPMKFDLGALERWPGRWLFVGAVGGLGLGAFLVRGAKRSAIRAALRPDAKQAGESPDEALAGLRAMIASIERDVKLHADDSARLAVIADRIDEAQKTHLDAFLQSRALLQGRLGLSGFAILMERFSVGERKLNRAWSVAVDGVYPEAIACVREADACFKDAQRALGG